MAAVPQLHIHRLRDRLRRRTLAASVVAGLVVVLGAPSGLADLPAPTVVWFRGHTISMLGQPTVADLFREVSATPRTGRLMSMRGEVLTADAHPPSIVRNDEPAQLDTRLVTGDRVDYADGQDSTEPVVLETTREGNGNPQFVLGAAVVTLKRGTISGEVETVSSIGGGPPKIALTFDDGPHPAFTPAILDILKAKGAPATFFVLGLQAARYKDLVRREVAEGHAVADHSWNHPRLAGRPAPFVQQQLAQTRDVLASAGASVKLFRPPYGSYDGTTVQVAQGLGMRTVIWRVDTSDYRKPGANVIAQRALAGARPGAIVLLHDGGGDRSQTVAALPIIIDELRNRGYELVLI